MHIMQNLKQQDNLGAMEDYMARHERNNGFISSFHNDVCPAVLDGKYPHFCS